MEPPPAAAPDAARLGLAVIHPDRPHNLGALMRLAACLGADLELVEPAAFPLDDRRLREAALDYWRLLRWRRHADLDGFLAAAKARPGRTVLLSTRGAIPYHAARYRADDLLVVGSERAGAPEPVHRAADLVVRVPMRAAARSLNVAAAAAIVLAEAMRQTGGLGDVPGAPEEGETS